VSGAKDLVVQPIASAAAREFVKKHHYSGKVAANSQLHLGVFWKGKLEGVMQFGPSLDKSKVVGLVKDTGWNDFLELNRMAFSDVLPKNSESRAISVAMRLIKKHKPNVEWVISFADGAQCGDGTIYRASGFVLTQIRKNKTILRMPDGSAVADISLNISGRKDGKTAGWWKKNGAVPIEGHQLRYIYFLNAEAKDRLTVPILPFSAIADAGAKMYRGERLD
jgi:hypothetical protein